MTLVANQIAWLPDATIVDGLPPEFHDLAPRGFLGRIFPRQHADLGLPTDITNWSDHHVLIALSQRGEDLPGDLIIGDKSYERWSTLNHAERTLDDYRTLARDALAGEHAGSSAGGEQPKFTALVGGRHRLVKFASSASDNARRWQDLLNLEHVALTTLLDAGIAASETELIDIDEFRFLVVERFDRIDIAGRRAVLTLAATVDQADATWSAAAAQLHANGRLSSDDQRTIALLDAFGSLIANTDRHLHNVLLYPHADGFTLAPAFDQLPMAYAPPASGNLRMEARPMPRPSADMLDVWDNARTIARDFWQAASEQPLSHDMQAIVQQHVGQHA